MDTNHLNKLLLVLVLLISVANISLTTAFFTTESDGEVVATIGDDSDAVSDIRRDQSATVSDVEDSYEVSIRGNVISNNAFTLSIPSDLLISRSGSSVDTVRIQNYSEANDTMPAGGFFMYVWASDSDGDMASNYRTTEQGQFYGAKGVQANGDGYRAHGSSNYSRAYYFPDHYVGITIFAGDEVGLAAAETAIKGIILR